MGRGRITVAFSFTGLASANVALLLALSPQPVRAEPQGDAAPPAVAETPKPETRARAPRPSTEELCRTLAQAAADNALPVEFFTRLIWQESRFDPHAVSRKGAQGIAQFMPSTASGRGLADPFEPLLALRESASYLNELRTTFGGSLGLAAAAYNAGPGRVEAWLAGRGGLPAETRAYVLAVTGHSADVWALTQPPQWQASDIPKGVPCVELGKLVTAGPRPPRPASTPSPAWGPWGVQLAGNWSEGQVLATYERLRRKHHAVLHDRLPLVLRANLPGGRASKYIARVSESNRTSAEALCAKLRATGGACIVLRNPPG
jgi:hypothetical protein